MQAQYRLSTMEISRDRQTEQEQSETAWYAHLPTSVNALLVDCA